MKLILSTLSILAVSSLAFAQCSILQGPIRIDGIGPNDVRGISNLRQSCESLDRNYYGFSLVFNTSSMSSINWLVLNDLGEVVISRSGYCDFGTDPEGSIKRRVEYFCLPEGCYTFIIRDSSSPCCEDGYFSFREGSSSTVLAEGPHSAEKTVTFCTSDIERCIDDVKTVVAYYDFEDDQNGWLCGGFGLTTCTYVASNASNPLNGNGALRITGNGVAASPLLNYTVSQGNQYRVKFLARTSGYTDGDKFVLVMRDGLGNFTREFVFEEDFNNNVTDEYIIELSSSNNQVGFYIRGMTGNPNALLWVDNFIVEEVPICVEALAGEDPSGSKQYNTNRARLRAADKDYGESLLVYPNPVNSSSISVLYHTEEQIISKFDYGIYSITGQSVLEGSFSSESLHRIYLPDLKEGVYIFRVSGLSSVVSKPLIIK